MNAEWLAGRLEQVDFHGLTMPRLRDCLASHSVPEGHARRVFGQLHRVRGPLEQTPGMGKHLLTLLGVSRRSTVTPVRAVASSDGTERLVFELADGRRVEGVLIPNPRVSDRLTLCLSSQVGCAMGCTFCATGTLGLTRNLRPGEIVGQVYAAQERATARGQRVTHLVFMGMGEPMHNYESVRDALRILFDPHGQPMDMRRVTVSTVGLISKMRRFSDDFGGRVQLALSLHAGTDETRAKIIPTARTVSMSALRKAIQAHPLPGSRHLMIEYVVLPGINDSEAEIAALVRWMDGIRGIVNLIPYNPFAGGRFRRPSVPEVESVREQLLRARIPVRVRWPRGHEAHGACGQLMLADQKVPTAYTPGAEGVDMTGARE